MKATTEPGFELTGESARLPVLLKELWRSRALLEMLAKKEFIARFRRASLGVLWAIGLPLAQAAVIGAVMGLFVRFDTGLSYAVFVFAGMLPWTYFSGVLSLATTSIVDGSDLATRVYFPRAVLPLVALWAGFRGFVPAVAVLIGLAALFDAPLGVDLLLLIPATIVMLALTAGFSLIAAALHVYFRDMKFIIQAVMLPWFWASGVIFPLTALKGVRPWLELNPAVGMIELFRAGLGEPTPGWERPVLICLIWIVGLLVLALPLYKRYDRVFVDLM